MKLLFDLPTRDEQAFLAVCAEDEKRMYCVPYDFEGERRVSGFMVITDKRIYRILEGEVLDVWSLSEMSDFSVETFYGACGFYAKVRGNSTLLCRFISGRNLPRYSVLQNACDELATGKVRVVSSNEPERFCPKCGRPFVVHTKICPFCQSKKEIYKKLWGMTRGLRLMMLFPLVVAMIGMVIRFVVPAVQKIAINYYIYPQDNAAPSAVVETLRSLVGDVGMQFIVIVICIVTLDLFHRALGVVQSRLAAVSGNRFTRMLRALLFEKIQMLSMASIQNKSTGDLMGRINNDVAVVQNFITNLLPTYFAQLFSFVMALGLLVWLSPVMCLFIFIPLPIAVFCIVKFWSFMQKRNVRAWILDQRTNRGLQDVLNGIRVVKAYGNEEKAIDEFEYNTAKQSRQEESNAKLFDTLFPILGFVVHFGSYLIMMFGNVWLYQGSLDLGTLNQFNSYAGIVYEPLMQITAIPRNISAFITSLSKILEILEEEPEVSDIELPLDIRIEGDVEIKHVTFGYDSYNPVLKDINVSIKQGEMIGVVGHSGCGKTTLINLIMRLYDVTEGEIVIDDVNIKDISQNALRSQIGVVLQETHLFSGSIRDNIRYAKPHATSEEIIAAARMANAHDFIMSLPEGYNTMVGEKGYSLSGGERQRIAIARALIHDPRILILDEATAALDTETEKLIQDAITKVTKGRTTFAIAHRLSTLRNADKLLVLDHGRLAEFGTHTELLEKKGIYYKLVMAQHRATLAKQAGVEV
ncbi:MAG: ABC transporter ATP-binding protein [Clostridia bacterium]|nr:ABC transporter ATP-binding protein [Clostridia bacterium]